MEDRNEVGATGGSPALTLDEAKALQPEEIKKSLRVKGNAPPFGGSWLYDPAADELTLGEAPTQDGGPRKGEEEEK